MPLLTSEGYRQIGGRCGTPEPTLTDVFRIDANLDQLRKIIPAAVSKGAKLILQINFVHISKSGGARVTQDARERQLSELNSAYNLFNIFFTSNPENIIEIENSEWYNVFPKTPAERAMKSAHSKDPNKFVNVYTCGLEYGLLGWSSFPWEKDADPIIDGLVIAESTLPGGTNPKYNLGRTMVHEMGHYLGLFHTFYGGCDGIGDQVEDTIAHSQPNYNNPAPGHYYSCIAGEMDPISNFMNYTDDVCMNMFTSGQGKRMLEQCLIYRRNFVANLDEIESASSVIKDHYFVK